MSLDLVHIIDKQMLSFLILLIRLRIQLVLCQLLCNIILLVIFNTFYIAIVSSLQNVYLKLM